MTDVNLFPLYLSLRVATTATVITFIIGLPIAYFLSRRKNRISDLIDTLFTLPIILPPTVLGYYLLILLGRNSAIGKWLETTFDTRIVFTPTGAVVAAVVVSIPFLVKSAKAAFANINDDMINAAKMLGRSNFSIFITIMVPLAWRGIAAGVTLAFARALGDFGTTLMVAGSIPNYTQTMPIAIYDALLAGNKNLANLLVMIMTAVALTVLYIVSRLEKRMERGRS